MRSYTLARAAFRAALAVLICSVVFAEGIAPSGQRMANGFGAMFKPNVVTSFPCDPTAIIDPSKANICLVPESITADHEGNLYVGLTNWVSWFQNPLWEEWAKCQIMKITPDGTQIPVAVFPNESCPTTLLAGVAFDEENRLHVAVYSWSTDNNTSGVYRVETDGTQTRVLSLPADSFPNGLAFFNGDMYVSDSALGAIWKKGRHDGVIASVPWYPNAGLLAPSGFGANGIAFYQNALYIAVSNADAAGTTGSIVRLPIRHNGSPGEPEFFVRPDARLCNVDGIAFDLAGRLWFTVNTGQSGSGGRLGIVDRDGTLRILADDPGWLDDPTMVVFGTTFRTMGTIFLTNGGMNSGQPNVLSLFVGVPGLPLPAR